jgi:hypothetical protein
MRTADSIEETKVQKSLKAGKSSKGTKHKSHRMHPNSLKALKVAAWPKGVSGNPGGLPGFDVAAHLARTVIEENREAIYEGLSKAAMTGNAYVFKELAERGYGKMKESLEITRNTVKDADIDKRITELLRDLGLARAIDETGRVEVAHAGAGPTNGKAKVTDVLS